MRIEVKKLTGLPLSRATRFDLHEDFGLACLVEDKGEVTLYFNDLKCRTWAKEERLNIWGVKWFDANHVVLDLEGPKIAIVSATAWEQYELGYRSELYLSPKFMLAIYGEEQFYSSRSGDLEGHLISVFSGNGTFEVGIRELLDKDRDAWKFDELEAGYIFDNKFAFIAYASELFWVLDVSKRSWAKFPTPVSLWRARVLSGDAEKAYGIFDNRWYRDHDRPPFELAVFDLVAETAWMQDFAPVESALIAARFSMSEIKFQPSSTGKIIVSDGKKAALLDFSDSA
jgi:hypothetical protein